MQSKQRTLIFLNIIISVIASSTMATALTTALPSIITQFHVSVTTGQWLTSGYSLAMGIVMPLTAFLITKLPTKRLYIGALLLFIGGLLVSLFASSFAVLMAGRILQALGNGVLGAMAQVILLTIYPLERRGSIMGWYGLSIGAAPVIAPTIAGMLVDSFGWRSIFLLVTVIMMISLVMAFFVFQDILEVRDKQFDAKSFLLSGAAFAGITVGIGNIGTYSLVSVNVLLPLIVGVIASGRFIQKQLHSKEPFLDLRVIKDRNFAIALLGSILLYFAMMGSSIILPLTVQSALGKSATISGLVSLPGSLAMTIISPFAGRIYDKFGMKKLFIVGSIALILSNLGMTTIGVTTSLVVIASWNILRSVAIGCLMMPLVTWGMGRFTTDQMAHGTALINSLRTISGAIGAALFVSLMNFVTRNVTNLPANAAAMKGVNAAFLGMTTVSVLLFLTALIAPKSKN